MLDFLVNLWYDVIMKDKFMHQSTLDLFCQEPNEEYADEYSLELEKLASKYQVTVDYIIQEFILD